MNPVVHFEMPAKDRKRMADFYTRVFGWRSARIRAHSMSLPPFVRRSAKGSIDRLKKM